MDYFNEEFLNLDDRSETISGMFADGLEQDIEKIMRKMTKEANDTHNAECPHNEECRGVLPYMLAALKRHFLYNEMTERERLALVAVVMYSLGVRGGEERMIDREMDNFPKPPSFEEFMRIMRKGSTDGEKGDK